MKVLLLEDIQKLGKAGEICEVKEGYGQNFLIAKGKAKLATNEVIKRYRAQLKAQEEQKALAIATTKQLASFLNDMHICILRKVGANNTLFGSITKAEIAQEINKYSKVTIDKKCIEADNIKQVGVYDITIKLGSNISATLKLEVKPLAE